MMNNPTSNLHSSTEWSGRVVANDMEGRERLARYLIRPTVSLERLTYDGENQQVCYQGEAETHTYQPLDFLAYVSLHISDKGEQIVRYYGWYSDKSRLNDLTHYQKKCWSGCGRPVPTRTAILYYM